MHRYTEYAVGQVLTLCRMPSPTGYTRAIGQYLFDTLAQMGYKPETLVKGGVRCLLGGQGRPLALIAHADTLGLIVRAIKDNGRLRYEPLSAYSHYAAATENVTVFTRQGREVTGVIQCTKPSSHVWGSPDAVEKDNGGMEILLDEPVKSAEDVRALGVEVGDIIAYDPRTVRTAGGFIKSRHLDDKASCGVLLALAKAAAKGDIRLNRKVTLLFTMYEEVGHGGSTDIPQDVLDAVSVDMGCVGDDLGCDEFMVSICAKDAGGPYDYDLTGDLIQAAKRSGCAYAVDIYPRYGSDVEASLRAGFNVRHGLVGPGIYASHGYERTHIDSLDNALRLLEEFVVG